jgi:hypothetical protein
MVAFFFAIVFVRILMKIRRKMLSKEPYRLNPAFLLNVERIAAVASAITFGYWFLTGFGRDFVIGWLTLSDVQPINVAAGTFSRQPLIRLWDRVPYVLLLVGVITCIVMVIRGRTRKFMGTSALVLVGAGLGIGLVTVLLSLLGVEAAIPDRWMFFLELFGMSTLAYLLYVIQRAYSIIGKVVWVSIIFTILFSAATNGYSNLSTVFPSREQAPIAFDVAEVESAYWVSQYGDQVSTDSFYELQFEFIDSNLTIIDGSATLVDSREWTGILVLREAITTLPFTAFANGTYYSSPPSASLPGTLSEHSMIFDSGEVACYIH